MGRKNRRTTILRESITNQTNVSLGMAKHLFSKESDNNIVFSPLSIQVVLSIIAAGCEGPTQQQLLDLLQSKSTDHLNYLASQLVSAVLSDAARTGGPRLSFVNGVWVEQTLSLQPSFKRILSSNYKSTLSSVDFMTKSAEVIKEVNLWAEKKTNGLIKELLPPRSVDELTRLIFANALYFKGAWSEKFDVSKTKDYDFHLLNGSSVKVPFMTSKEKQFIEAYDDFKVLRLLYKKGEEKRHFSMYIFLPNAKDGLSALVDELASKPDLLHYSLCPAEVEVGEFRIPRFKISFELETSRMLKELGVVSPFTPGGLTKMVDSSLAGNSLSVSKIFHKSFIEVNEEGTEAVAASAGYCFAACASEETIDFLADHPFLFLIREDSTKIILFVGQALNPLDE